MDLDTSEFNPLLDDLIQYTETFRRRTAALTPDQIRTVEELVRRMEEGRDQRAAEQPERSAAEDHERQAALERQRQAAAERESQAAEQRLGRAAEQRERQAAAEQRAIAASKQQEQDRKTEHARKLSLLHSRAEEEASHAGE